MKLKPEILKLKSGLRIVMVPMETESVTVIAIVGTGSRNEVAKDGGVAHFVEHFVSNGTKKYTDKKDIWMAVESVGGIRNAYTSKEVTAYWVKVAKEQLELAVDLTGELVTRPLFPDKHMEKERGIILEELKMYEDKPDRIAIEKYEGQMFGSTSLGRDIVGTRKTLEEMSTAKLKSFWSDWYTPDNVVVGVAGGFGDSKKFVALVEEKFSELVKPGKKKPIVEEYEFNYETPKVSLINKKTEQAHLVMGVEAPKRGTEKRYVLAVMNAMLGGMASSRLFQAVREDKGLAYYVGSDVEAYTEAGYWAAAAGVKKENAEEAVKVIRGEVVDFFGKRKPKQKELDRAKAYIKGVTKLQLEQSNRVIDRMVTDMALEGRVRTLEEVIKGVDEVSVDDVVEEARKLFEAAAFNLTMVGPFKREAPFLKILS